jgi:hypothetical protein
VLCVYCGRREEGGGRRRSKSSEKRLDPMKYFFVWVERTEQGSPATNSEARRRGVIDAYQGSRF